MRTCRARRCIASGRGAEDEGFDDFLALGSGVDDFSFDVGAVEQPDVDGVPLGRFGVEIAQERWALQDEGSGGRLHTGDLLH